MKDTTGIYKGFRIAAFILLMLLAVEIPLVVTARKASYNEYLDKVTAAVISGDTELANKLAPSIETAGTIYSYNCVLCILSILLIIAFLIVKFSSGFDKKFNLKKSIIKNWPCILLAIFMAWTSVGCIQAGMEANAEAIVNKAIKENTLSDVPQRIIDIANWTPGDRMTNAADRSWNGCNNLKDGYFSFMFYATILINVVLLGVGSENYKRYLMRALTISSFLIGVFTFLAFFKYSALRGTLYFDRSLFNNRNHFGYYISVILIMSTALFVTEKNLYFKVMSFLNSILYIILLFMCDTFGAYLGVLFGMIYILVTLIIRCVSQKKIRELVFFAPILIVFVAFSFSFVKATSTVYSTSSSSFDYATLTFNFGDSTFMRSYNSMSEEKAKSYGLSGNTKDGGKVLFGNQLNKLDKNQKCFVQRNFESTAKDFGKMLGFFKNSSESKGSGDAKEELFKSISTKYPRVANESDTDRGLRYNNILNEIAKMYPKVSGETLEEWQARQTKIEEDYKEYIQKYESNSSTSEDETTIDDLSNVGSGRGPVWVRSLDLMNQRPWFGWGLENLLNEFYEQYNISEGRTHNLVLQLGGTTGIPGVLMYLIATISIWFKVLYDAKFRKFSKKSLLIILAVCIVLVVITNLAVSAIANKLFFNGVATTVLLTIFILLVFTEKAHLRVKEFNEFEFISTSVFASYMINSLFGNSAFYTSPYFMIFMGMLTFEMLNKKSVYAEIEEPSSKKKAKK